MATLTDLADQMDKLAIRAVEFGNEVKKDVANTVLTDLAQSTPLDVGEAESNWQVTLDTPVLSGLVLPAFAPSPKGRMKKGVWEHAVDPAITSQANVPPTIQAGSDVIQNALPEQPIFITNNAPQIVPLDQGSSSQAPAGFVDRAVMLGEQVVDRARFIP